MTTRDAALQAVPTPPDVDPDRGETLPPRQERGLALLLAGKTQTEVAEALGLTRGAVWWWCHRDPRFAAEYERRAADLRRATQTEVAQGALEAVRHLRGVLAGTADADPAKQQAAAILARPALSVGVDVTVTTSKRTADPSTELADAEAILRDLLGSGGDGT